MGQGSIFLTVVLINVCTDASTSSLGVLVSSSGVINIGQLDERGSEVLIKDGVLRIRDQEQRLLAKVKRSLNRLYLLDLKVEQPVCLAIRRTEEPWLWHARFGHLSFDALGRLEKMVQGLPHIEPRGELCDSCLAEK